MDWARYIVALGALMGIITTTLVSACYIQPQHVCHFAASVLAVCGSLMFAVLSSKFAMVSGSYGSMRRQPSGAQLASGYLFTCNLAAACIFQFACFNM